MRILQGQSCHRHTLVTNWPKHCVMTWADGIANVPNPDLGCPAGLTCSMAFRIACEGRVIVSLLRSIAVADMLYMTCGEAPEPY